MHDVPTTTTSYCSPSTLVEVNVRSVVTRVKRDTVKRADDANMIEKFDRKVFFIKDQHKKGLQDGYYFSPPVTLFFFFASRDLSWFDYHLHSRWMFHGPFTMTFFLIQNAFHDDVEFLSPIPLSSVVLDLYLHLHPEELRKQIQKCFQ